jgi:hypothetical protein
LTACHEFDAAQTAMDYETTKVFGIRSIENTKALHDSKDESIWSGRYTTRQYEEQSSSSKLPDSPHIFSFFWFQYAAALNNSSIFGFVCAIPISFNKYVLQADISCNRIIKILKSSQICQWRELEYFLSEAAINTIAST